MIVGGFLVARADTIQLKGRDSVSGKILVEKPDSVVVDLGYTVLVIPRDQITKIITAASAGKTPAAEAALKAAVEAVTAPGAGFTLSKGSTMMAWWGLCPAIAKAFSADS